MNTPLLVFFGILATPCLWVLTVNLYSRMQRKNNKIVQLRNSNLPATYSYSPLIIDAFNFSFLVGVTGSEVLTHNRYTITVPIKTFNMQVLMVGKYAKSKIASREDTCFSKSNKIKINSSLDGIFDIYAPKDERFLNNVLTPNLQAILRKSFFSSSILITDKYIEVRFYKQLTSDSVNQTIESIDSLIFEIQSTRDKLPQISSPEYLVLSEKYWVYQVVFYKITPILKGLSGIILIFMTVFVVLANREQRDEVVTLSSSEPGYGYLFSLAIVLAPMFYRTVRRSYYYLRTKI